MTSQTDADRAARNIQLVRPARLGALSGDHKGWPELLRFFGQP